MREGVGLEDEGLKDEGLEVRGGVPLEDEGLEVRGVLFITMDEVLESCGVFIAMFSFCSASEASEASEEASGFLDRCHDWIFLTKLVFCPHWWHCSVDGWVNIMMFRVGSWGGCFTNATRMVGCGMNRRRWSQHAMHTAVIGRLNKTRWCRTGAVWCPSEGFDS
eukprot:3866577-Pyramimonas_sp.AAC.2